MIELESQLPEEGNSLDVVDELSALARSAFVRWGNSASGSARSEFSVLPEHTVEFRRHRIGSGMIDLGSQFPEEVDSLDDFGALARFAFVRLGDSASGTARS